MNYGFIWTSHIVTPVRVKLNNFRKGEKNQSSQWGGKESKVPEEYTPLPSCTAGVYIQDYSDL